MVHLYISVFCVANNSLEEKGVINMFGTFLVWGFSAVCLIYSVILMWCEHNYKKRVQEIMCNLEEVKKEFENIEKKITEAEGNKL